MALSINSNFVYNSKQMVTKLTLISGHRMITPPRYPGWSIFVYFGSWSHKATVKSSQKKFPYLEAITRFRSFAPNNNIFILP
jgi:hypothetical protein